MKYVVTSNGKYINFKEWDIFVRSHPEGNVFQSGDFYFFVSKVKNFEPIAIQLTENGKIKGTLLAVIIREYSSLIGTLSARTLIHGGPLVLGADSDSHNIMDILLKHLIQKVKRKSVFIQFRNMFDIRDYSTIFSKNGFEFKNRLNYIVGIANSDNVLNRFSKSKVRQIKKGITNGAEIISPKNINQVKEFYEILHYLYKFKIKKPLPTWSFFEQFYDESKKNRLGVIRLIQGDNKIIGGILCPISHSNVIYEWYVCGLDHQYKQFYPSVLATWAAIEYALNNDIKYFDFMGVGVPDREYGVRDFKSKFGGKLVNYGRFSRINNTLLHYITEIGFNLVSLSKKA